MDYLIVQRTFDPPTAANREWTKLTLNGSEKIPMDWDGIVSALQPAEENRDCWYTMTGHIRGQVVPYSEAGVNQIEPIIVEANKVRGFTFIELLVVIAVIAILASLLLPVLSKAKQKAHAATCLSNERQLYLAYSSYVSDSQDRLPFADGETNVWCPAFDIWWLPEYTIEQSPLKPYIGNGRVWQCPSYVYGSFGPVAFSYAANQFIGGSSYDPDDAYYDPPPPVITYHKLDGQLSRDGAQLFLFMDWRRDFSCGSSFLIDPFHFNQPDKFQWWSIPAVDHGHGAAFVFIDGHAEIHHWRDSRTLPVPFTEHDDVSMANNQDIGWVQEHSSRLK